MKAANIDGEKMITFTPNTITYAVPADRNIGKKIARNEKCPATGKKYKHCCGAL